ncbi:cytochrome P450 4c21 isoform X2 [Halyomorpha halys]|nr:cytochrome P450 4c21 [Halyomorpha halys]
MLITLLFTIITFYGFYLWMVSRKYSHLPGNLGIEFPIIGNLYYSLKTSFLDHDGIIAHLKPLFPPGGGLHVMWYYWKPVVAISNPFMVEKLAGHPAFGDKESMVYESLPNFWKGIALYANADSKLKLRKKIINRSMTNQNLTNYHNIFVKMSKRMVDKMQHEKGTFNVERYTSMTAMGSIIETHFGSDLNAIDNDEVYNLMRWGMRKVAITLFNPIFGFLLNIFIAVNNTLKPVHQIIETCQKNLAQRQQNVTKDESKNLYFEDMLKEYSSIDSNYEEFQQVIREVMFVGSQSVSNLVTTSLAILATLPDIQEKAWHEQQNIFGDSDRDPTTTDIKNMEYLERFVKEAVRFVTCPSTVRKTKAEIIIDGKIIPPNTSVILCHRIMFMDSYYWENPSIFNPDRYLGDEPSKSYNHALSAFGYGIRNCPGAQFAYDQAKIMLSTILRRFKVVSDKRYEDIKQSAQIVMEITDGHHISIVKRKK